MVESVTLEPKTYQEFIDAVGTKMKEPHKKFGNYAKRLATIVKRVVNPSKGMWQPWWTIGARVFGFAHKGHNIDVCKAVATSLADEMGVDPGKAEELAEAIYNNLAYILGEKSKGVPELIL